MISIAVSILSAAVGATYVITRKITGVEKDVSKTHTDIDDLEENLRKVEDDLRYMFRLDLEESKKEAAELRRDLRISKDEEKKD